MQNSIVIDTGSHLDGYLNSNSDCNFMDLMNLGNLSNPFRAWLFYEVRVIKLNLQC